MFRYVNLQRLPGDLRRMRDLNQQLGSGGLEPYFERVLRDGWLQRNPEIYHLLEVDGELRGYFGLVPLTPASYQEFLDGSRYPFTDLRAADILPIEDCPQAWRTGLHVYVESFSFQDDEAAQLMYERAFGCLVEANLRGILATSSQPEDERLCRWWGLIERYERGVCSTGVRKLWFADAASLAAGPDPLGRPVPLHSLFLYARHHFGAGPRLGLSPVQRQVARLFYLEDKTEREIASRLRVKPGTVKTHLKRIREKAEPVVGSRLARRLTAWFQAHPDDVHDPAE